jgi:hypothetical protein
MLKNISIDMPQVTYRNTSVEEFIFNTKTQSVESIGNSFLLKSIFNKRNSWALNNSFLLLLALFFRYIMIDRSVSCANEKRAEILHLFKGIARQCWS